MVLLTAIATLGAFLYNMAAALLGGVEVTLAEDQIRLEGPLKELGLYTVKVRVAAEIHGELKVWVVPTVGADAEGTAVE